MIGKNHSNTELIKLIKGWKSLIENMPNPVSILDIEFNVLMANRDFVNLFVNPDDEKVRKRYQLVSPEDNPKTNSPDKSILKKIKHRRFEIYDPLLKKYLVVMTSPATFKENFIGYIYSIVDMTELKASVEDNKELVEIYAETTNILKKEEIGIQNSRDAFLNMLEDISASYEDLEDLFIKLTRALVNALDAKSPWTKGHSENVAKYAEQIAMELGLEENISKHLRLGGLLHDIGKIGTYDYLLNKPERLTKEEYNIVKKHPLLGANMVEGIKQLENIIPIIKYHHERIDGLGYPEGLEGEMIPLCAKIVHVADSFDSMTADRPYRASPGIDYAVSELKKYSGTQFDNQITEAFLKVLDNSHENSN